MKKNLLISTILLSALSAYAGGDTTSATTGVDAAKIQSISKSIVISDTWIRHPSSTSLNTAAYFVLANNSDKDIMVVDAITSTDACERTEIHGYKSSDNDAMKMYKLENVTIPAYSAIEFKPGSYHVMLMSIKKAFAIGDVQSITLKLNLAETNQPLPDVTANFTVKQQ